jgi:probable F420-dependent oxidoreductase
MRLGVVFPQTDLPPDVGAIRAYARAATDLGFAHILAYDHVLGADPTAHPGWSGPYNVDSTFHEPFVLFGFLAGITPLELVTSVIILPQRQTALVAKQAAQVDVLTGGRLRLGVGLGWNRVEYEALGQDFTRRGQRIEEQVALLRDLWTQRRVTFTGRHDRVVGAGIAPPPIQRPIPVWFGAQSPPAYRRTGRLADGWFPQMSPGPDLDAARSAVERAAIEAGRDPATIGMHGRIRYRPGQEEAFAARLGQWRDTGADHLSVDTMRAGLTTVDDHIAALTTVAGLRG